MKCLKSFLILFLALEFLAACGSKAPPTTMCVIYVPKDMRDMRNVSVWSEEIVAICTNPDGSEVELQATELDKFVAIPGDEAIKYIEYCGLKDDI